MQTNQMSRDDTLGQPLLPHTYPVWVYVSLVVLIIPLLNFVSKLPVYYDIHAKITNAEHTFKKKDYRASIKLFNELQDQFPESKKFRIRFAQACFAEGFNYNGLKAVQDINLNKREWQELCEYMPEEFEHCFTSEKES